MLGELEVHLNREILDLALEFRDSLDMDALEDAIEDYDVEAVIRTANVDRLYARLTVLLSAFLLSAFMAVGRYTAADIGVDFNSLEPRYVSWLQGHVAQSVAGLTSTARDALRATLVRGIQAGLDAEELSRQIYAYVFLTDRQAAAIERMRRAMVANRMPKSRVRAAFATAVLAALAFRVQVITVTEITSAATAAELLVWKLAFEEGLITENRKTWITQRDERVCPVCGPLDNVTVDLYATFPGGFDGPPSHPRCRCRLVLSTRGVS